MERQNTPTPTPATVARCAPAVLNALLSQPTPPAVTMAATLVAGRTQREYPDVNTTSLHATVSDWVAAQNLHTHPGTVWVVRTIGTSVDVGTNVVYVDNDHTAAIVHTSAVDVAEMVRYYAGGMVDTLGAMLDTCHTAYDVVAAVCNHLVATGNEPFYIDGEMLALVMYTGDHDSPLTAADLSTYAEMWYKSYDAAMAEMVAAVCNRLVATGVDVYSMGASVVAGGLSMAYDEIEYYFEHWYNDEGHKWYKSQPATNDDDATGFVDLHDVVSGICDVIMSGVYATTPYGTVGVAYLDTPTHYNDLTPEMVHHVTFGRYNGTPAERTAVILGVHGWKNTQWVNDTTNTNDDNDALGDCCTDNE